MGFDEKYFSGKADGFAEARIETVKNCLVHGFDEEIIGECTGILLKELEKFKNKL